MVVLAVNMLNQIYVYDPTEDERSAAQIRMEYMTLPSDMPRQKRLYMERLPNYLHDKLLLCNRWALTLVKLTTPPS